MHKFLFYNKFIICLYMFRVLCAHHQGVKLYYTASGIITHVGGLPVHRTQSSLNLRTAIKYFSTLSYKRHDFRKTLLNTKCLFRFSLQLLSEKFFILRGTERDVFKNEFWFSCKVLVILVRL